jgi:hypothetical protein
MAALLIRRNTRLRSGDTTPHVQLERSGERLAHVATAPVRIGLAGHGIEAMGGRHRQHVMQLVARLSGTSPKAT